ncbi:MAG: hypothetical protein LQ347_006818 [Umbilicaria vellea]|nr:MAG: hypothetical protein LQ347_006818 [Umbilicaria vellea]
MDDTAVNRFSVLPDAYAPPEEADQGTNLVPSLQPGPSTMHEPAVAEPGFETLIHNNPNPSPTTPTNGYTGHAFPAAATRTRANPAGPSSAIAGPSNTPIVPAVQNLVTVTGIATPARHLCGHPTCTSTFARASDLHRHAKIHQPNARRYDCVVPGCPYRGTRGFRRRDKLVSHQRNAHGLVSTPRRL